VGIFFCSLVPSEEPYIVIFFGKCKLQKLDFSSFIFKLTLAFDEFYAMKKEEEASIA